jgi:hypothetical protein
VVARRAHNPKVVGSNPTPATRKREEAGYSFRAFPASSIYGPNVWTGHEVFPFGYRFSMQFTSQSALAQWPKKADQRDMVLASDSRSTGSR